MAEMIKETVFQRNVIRVLRCRKTQRYFTGNGWAEALSQAKTFADEIEAARACVQHGLNDIDLVLRAPGADADLFTTPVR